MISRCGELMAWDTYDAWKDQIKDPEECICSQVYGCFLAVLPTVNMAGGHDERLERGRGDEEPLNTGHNDFLG
jgi:hypothetical protein